MNRCILALLLFAAAAASADTITFSPPNPGPHHSVDAIVRGSTGGCPARQLGIVKVGATIALRLTFDPPPDTGCPAAILPFTSVFHLDILPAGVYTVTAVVETAPLSSVREIARATLIVRDGETLQIDPYAVSTAGGGPVAITYPFSQPSTVTVTVDGAVVPYTLSGGGRLIVFNAPPHAAGAADVAVSSSLGTRTAKAGLIYFDPGALPTAAFELVLFPLSYEGPGAFGSQWTTENYLSDPNSTNSSNSTKRIINDNQPWGRPLYFLRGTIENIFFASRARDLSRQAQSAGVEIPVVREGDFRAGPVELLNVPNDKRFRVLLRAWTIEDSGSLAVTAGNMFQGSVPTTPVPGTNLSFASMDLTAAVQSGPATLVRLYGLNGSRPQPYIWAMISITNNETQEFTIISSR